MNLTAGAIFVAAQGNWLDVSFGWLVVLQIAFTRKKDFGKEERELKWAHAQRTLHGLQAPDTKMFNDRTSFTELNQMAEEAKRRAEIARYASINNKLTLNFAIGIVFPFPLRICLQRYSTRCARVISKGLSSQNFWFLFRLLEVGLCTMAHNIGAN